MVVLTNSGRTAGHLKSVLAAGAAGAASAAYLVTRGDNNNGSVSTLADPVRATSSQPTLTQPTNPNPTTDYRGNYTITGVQISNTGRALLNSQIRTTLIVQGPDVSGSSVTLIEAGSPPLTFSGAIQPKRRRRHAHQRDHGQECVQLSPDGAIFRKPLSRHSGVYVCPGNTNAQCEANARVSYSVSGSK
jgi:hypothetical protein